MSEFHEDSTVAPVAFSNKPRRNFVLFFFIVICASMSVLTLTIRASPSFRGKLPEVPASIYAKHNLADHVNPAAAAASRFLVFNAPFAGQGIGNMLTGLQGAHAMANYYNRSLCINWPSFNRVFTYPSKSACEDLQDQKSKSPGRFTTASITIVNWSNDRGKNDGTIQGETQIVNLQGNFYPLWWEVRGLLQWQYTRFFPPRFDQLYTPSEELAKKLPAQFPSTVLHLRMGDSSSECRAPFCHITERLWKQLATCLPKEGYLLSDRQDPYTHFGFLEHPAKRIPHSALTQQSRPDEKEMWAEWLILHHSTKIVHTHSEFSESAVRWARGEIFNLKLGPIDPITESMDVESGVDNVVPLVETLSDKEVQALQLKEHHTLRWNCTSR